MYVIFSKQVALKNHACKRRTTSFGNHDNKNKAPGLVDVCVPEGELLLQALDGFVLVVTAEGTVFYCSHTIQDYLGFHQTDVMHQSVFDLIHTEDQQEFRRNLHWALNPPTPDLPEDSSNEGQPGARSTVVTYSPDHLPPENSSFLERSFVCRFRCLLDNSSGFLALNLQGRLKFLHGQNQRLDDGDQAPPQLALFSVATPLQLPSILEIRTKNMIFRTKHKLDFTPMACDAKGKIVLGYTEAELRVRGSGYQFIHAADMLHCAENHIRMIKTGESGLTVFRLLTKDNRWTWVQSNARLVYKNGRPDYIIATQRPLVEEEGGEHLQKRSLHLPFTFATGEALLYQTSHPIPGFLDTHQGRGKSAKLKQAKSDKSSSKNLDPSSLLGAMMRQDESVYVSQAALEPRLSFHGSLFGRRGEGLEVPTPAQGKDLSVATNGVSESKPKLQTFDPLLTTLDSLTLESDENCSSAELFSALENLGMNAEDLELLLLDERMVQVDMDPDYIPSLNDLLTNNEILSYIHDSLEGRTENSLGGNFSGSRPPAPASFSQVTSHLLDTSAAPSTSQSHYLPAMQPKLPPIVQLSRQMQKHLSKQPSKVQVDTWCHQTQPQASWSADQNHKTSDGSVENGLDLWEQPLHNGDWPDHHLEGDSSLQNGLNDQSFHLQLLFNGEAQRQGADQQQDQHQLNPMPVQPAHVDDSTRSSHHCSSLGWSAQSAFLQKHTNVSSSELILHRQGAQGPPHSMDYSLTAVPSGGFTLNPNMQVYQGLMGTSSLGHTAPRGQVLCSQPSTCYLHCPSENLTMEQTISLNQPQQLPSLESYDTFSTMCLQDTFNKLESSSCVPHGSTLAYADDCLVPNGVPPESSHPSPGAPPASQTTRPQDSTCEAALVPLGSGSLSCVEEFGLLRQKK
ncbi:aryl hydrocarbon receptor 1b isoform X2 [Scleropages formosus]|uniref:Aryl hydrocarbon receptor 1b n=1 Tax=Scleropages formosus TaxID=113540 RepID=A0A8C9S2R3_SCLFO|nr:aryl hydrocarbon receptor-like isoform X2 [Scleropages formosus]